LGGASSPLWGLASLALVLGLFFLAALAIRGWLPAGAGVVPAEVAEVLGRVNLPGRQQAHLIRCGNKILLVCLGPGSVKTLTEISDWAEVERLSGLCRSAHATGRHASFRQVFQQYGDKSVAGLLARRFGPRSTDLAVENADA
jgi:flagellar biogenesis protein FliO